MNRILIVEDNIEIQQMETELLTKSGYETVSAYSGTEALLLTEKEDFDLIILDIMLPGMQGDEVLKNLKGKTNAGILCVSALDALDTRVSMMREGADDYIVKPFMLSALYAKCHAILKRTGNTEGQIVCGDICIDTKKLVCTVAGREVDLPPKSFAILRYLIEHRDWVVDRETLLDKVWDEDAFCVDRVIDNHIKKLRKALGSAGSQIHTVIGRGYRLSDR